MSQETIQKIITYSLTHFTLVTVKPSLIGNKTVSTRSSSFINLLYSTKTFVLTSFGLNSSNTFPLHKTLSDKKRIFIKINTGMALVFTKFILKNTNNYLEFGSGGSTVAASKYIKGRGYSIESEEEFSKKVEKETKDNITMFYIDIENIKPEIISKNSKKFFKPISCKGIEIASMGSIINSEKAAIPIFLVTAGSITKGPIPIVNSESLIEACSVAKQ